jgi:type II secretory pathway pseudopilin PulG
MINFNFKKNKGLARTCFRGGFTLLEALVATSILMVAISAPITIAQKGLSSAIFTKNQMIASYLAQDVIEYIKNKRDEIAINNSSSDWGNLWNGPDRFEKCISVTGCRIDTLNDAVNTFLPDDFLKTDDNKFYGYGSGDETNFTRKVEVTLIPVDVYRQDGNGKVTLYDEALITVTVSWGAGDDSLIVKTLIFNN